MNRKRSLIHPDTYARAHVYFRAVMGYLRSWRQAYWLTVARWGLTNCRAMAARKLSGKALYLLAHT